jgi:hypothetical protein
MSLLLCSASAGIVAIPGALLERLPLEDDAFDEKLFLLNPDFPPFPLASATAALQ